MPSDPTSWFPDHRFALVLTIIFYLWAASELFYSFYTRRMRRTTIAQRRDRGSYWIILLVVWGSMAASIFTRRNNLGVFHSDLQYVGLGITALGIGLRAWAVLTL